MVEKDVAGPRLARLLGSTWHVSGPAYRALADAMRLLILDGRLPPGTKVPGERELAGALAVSRTTVSAAYDVLRERGFLTSRRGSGTRASLPARRIGTAVSGFAPAGLTAAAAQEQVLDLACAALEAPAGLAPAVQAAVERLPEHLGGHGYEILGVPALRAAIAERYTARGLPTAPSQVVVTGGAVHALSLVVRLLVGPGDRVLVDSPTYPNALDAVRRASARPVPVPVDDEGWDPGLLEATLRQSAPRMAYLVPEFHNPTGLLMDPPTREHVAAALERNRTPVVVDETLVDLGLDVDEADLPAPLASHARGDAVLTIGSASKSFWGGLRVGWIRAAQPMVDRLVTIRASADLGTPVLEQLIVAELMAERETLLAARRAALRSRRAALREALAEHLPGWRCRVPAGGLALWCELEAPVSSALAATSAGHGVRLAAGPRFGLDGAFERYLRLPYTLPEQALRESVERIAEAHAALADAPPTARTATLLTA